MALDDLDLAAALTGEAEQFARRTGIECRMVVGATMECLPPEVETAAFRILQECLTNVARHARAGAWKSLKEIGAELALSEKTIATYRARISEKIGLATNVELTKYAMRHGLAD